MRDSARPWRIASAALAALETVLFAAAVVALLVGDGLWFYGLLASYVALEVSHGLLDRYASRHIAAEEAYALYASRPLTPRDRSLIVVSLVATAVIVPLLAVITVLDRELVPVPLFVLIVAAAISSTSRLARVLRHDSWLAISRLPPPRP